MGDRQDVISTCLFQGLNGQPHLGHFWLFTHHPLPEKPKPWMAKLVTKRKANFGVGSPEMRHSIRPDRSVGAGSCTLAPKEEIMESVCENSKWASQGSG